MLRIESNNKYDNIAAFIYMKSMDRSIILHLGPQYNARIEVTHMYSSNELLILCVINIINIMILIFVTNTKMESLQIFKIYFLFNVISI